MKKFLLILPALLILTNCEIARKDHGPETGEPVPFLWENANIYFLLTDRFYNGNPDNDLNFGREKNTAVFRGFEGGDLEGITKKIEEGYFSDLGITAIWFTPIVEQIHGIVDEGSGETYGYHGYWATDWTALDPNFGTEADLEKLVQTAHKHGIRIVLDVVINHTGPVTEADPVWPDAWVRTDPICKYEDYESTVECTLVENLPDIRTESEEDAELPQFLSDKWEAEGRLDKEMAELDAFFARSGYPRAPKYYIIKWITDFIHKYGIDAFRVDTVKHTEAGVWADLYTEASIAFEEYKKQHPEKVLDDNAFFMFGEVYGYNISSGRMYDYGDQKTDFFDKGFKSLINFEFKSDAANSYEMIFSKYNNVLQNELKGNSVVNYLTSHDDGTPFDKKRQNPIEAGTKLLLAPGSSQIYYGDETSRSLEIEGAVGDATLRSFMNWDEISDNISRGGYSIDEVLTHWQKLGTFRAAHPAVGAGVHKMISDEPYFFTRTYRADDYKDAVLVGLELGKGEKSVDVSEIFDDGEEIKDYYSGNTVTVKNGSVELNTDYKIVLLGK